MYLITIDTLRADHVQSYGYKGIETPAFTALARDGIQFDDAVSVSPLTPVSHASILTGRYPPFHGVTLFGAELRSGVKTWAEILSERNYDTAAFIGSVVLDSQQLAPGFDRGFQFYDNFAPSADRSSRWDRIERRAGEVAAHAERWLLTNTGAVFVWLHFYDPHAPYTPPAPFEAIYQAKPYDGEVAYTDQVLAQFVQFLKQRDRYNSSTIILVGDHGEGLGDHGEKTHGIFLYRSTLRGSHDCQIARPAVSRQKRIFVSAHD